MEFQEVQPESFEQAMTSKAEAAANLPNEPQAAPTAISPEKMQEIAQSLTEAAMSAVQEEFTAQLNEKNGLLEGAEAEKGTISETYAKELTDREKAFREEKAGMEEGFQKTAKQSEEKLAKAIAAKDKEIDGLKKQLEKKEKEVKDLFNEVKEALHGEEE